MNLMFHLNNGLVQNLSGNMIPARGYIVRAPSNYLFTSTTNYIFQLHLLVYQNSGTITVPVSAGATSMNLLGNPYLVLLSANVFLVDPANAATVGGTIYLWTHTIHLLMHHISMGRIMRFILI